MGLNRAAGVDSLGNPTSPGGGEGGEQMMGVSKAVGDGGSPRTPRSPGGGEGELGKRHTRLGEAESPRGDWIGQLGVGEEVDEASSEAEGVQPRVETQGMHEEEETDVEEALGVAEDFLRNLCK